MKLNNRFQQLRISNFKNHQAVAGLKNYVQASDDGQEATIYLYDIIDSDPYWGFTASELVSLLSSITAPKIHLRINSPGGDVWQARTMSTIIAQHPATFHAHIDGIAASASTFVAMACDDIEMAEGAFFMIHNAWTYWSGNANDFDAMAADLRQVDGSIRTDYMRKTGIDEEQITAWMDAETQFTAAQALEHGFVDSMFTPHESQTSNVAKWDLSAFANSSSKEFEFSLPVIDNAVPEPVDNAKGVPEHIQRNAQLLTRIC